MHNCTSKTRISFGYYAVEILVYELLTYIGYAKRIKSALDAKPKPSVGDTSDEDIVSTGINTNGSKQKWCGPSETF